jgi:septum formation topological specificity factor MinE
VTRELGKLGERLMTSTEVLKERLAVALLQQRMQQVPRRRFTA